LLDNVPGSLREAIALTEPGGTVDFQPGLTGTIALSAGQLSIDHDLAIAGPGADALTVSGGGASRGFNIAATSTVTISGFAIANGRVRSPNAQGGGIFNAGTLTLISSTLSGNAATAVNGSGGAGSGGGIFNAGTLTLISSTLSGNAATGGIGFGGG